jgi:hypothetical protein
MNLIERYKRLPEAKRVPDAVWEVQRILDLITEYEGQTACLKAELNIAAPKMMSILSADWTEGELIGAGLTNETMEEGMGR